MRLLRRAGTVPLVTVLMLGVLYIEPLQPIFKTTALGIADWLLVLFFAALPTFFFGFGSLLSAPKKKRTIRYSGGAGAGAAAR